MKSLLVFLFLGSQLFALSDRFFVPYEKAYICDNIGYYGGYKAELKVSSTHDKSEITIERVRGVDGDGYAVAEDIQLGKRTAINSYTFSSYLIDFNEQRREITVKFKDGRDTETMNCD